MLSEGGKKEAGGFGLGFLKLFFFELFFCLCEQTTRCVCVCVCVCADPIMSFSCTMCAAPIDSSSSKGGSICYACQLCLIEYEQSHLDPISADLASDRVEYSPPPPAMEFAKSTSMERYLKDPHREKRRHGADSSVARKKAKCPAPHQAASNPSLIKLDPATLCIDPLMPVSPPFAVPFVLPSTEIVGQPFWATKPQLGRRPSSQSLGPQAEMLSSFASMQKNGYTHLQLKYLRITKRQGKNKPPRVQHLFGYMPYGNFCQLLKNTYTPNDFAASTHKLFGDHGVARRDFTFLEFIPSDRHCKLHFDVDLKRSSEPTPTEQAGTRFATRTHMHTPTHPHTHTHTHSHTQSSLVTWWRWSVLPYRT